MSPCLLDKIVPPVPKIRLGDTSIEVPIIGFGTWQYSSGVEPLVTAIESGATFIDTAETYGSEEVVGEALVGRRREVFLATKVRPANFRRRDLIAAADRSLRRLRTDYIDLYQLHWPNYTVPIEETMSAMEELVEAGKIRFIGVSNFYGSDLEAAQNALKKNKVVSNQVKYSLIERTIESGPLAYCREHHITIIAFSPFGTHFPLLYERDPEGVLAKVAERNGKTIAQVALNWILRKEGIVIIPKASTVEHVRDDCGAVGWQLPEQDIRLLSDRVRFTCRGSMERFARKLGRSAVQRMGRSL